MTNNHMNTMQTSSKATLFSIIDFLKFYKFQKRVFKIGDTNRKGFIVDWIYDSMGHVQTVNFQIIGSKDVVESAYWKEIIFG